MKFFKNTIIYIKCYGINMKNIMHENFKFKLYNIK